jgi:hypothetical protein
LIRDAINRILELSLPQPLELEGRPHTTRPVFPVATPLPESLKIHFLTGLRDYLNENPDGLDLDHVLVQVYSPTMVSIKSTLMPPFSDRASYLSALHEQPVFAFGKYMDIETFIIELQSKFVQDEMVAAILQLVGNITDDTIRIYADDGVTQEVTSKDGIGRVMSKAVPNPVVLSPYRTFNEIVQPEGRFVFRLKGGSGTNTGRPAVALFDADGGVWENTAIRSIQQWLRQEIVHSEVVVVA